MKLNSNLREFFKEYNIDPALGIVCLLTVYHNICICGKLHDALDSTMMQINVSKIIEKDYQTQTVTWNVPLYEGEVEDDDWNWINKEYRPMFKSVNAERAGSSTSCVKKMKEFFKKHPAVRKQDVMEAVKLYIESIGDPQYLTQADYFIFKNNDRLSSYASKLEQYLEILKDNNEKALSVEVNHKMMS